MNDDQPSLDPARSPQSRFDADHRSGIHDEDLELDDDPPDSDDGSDEGENDA